MSVIETIKSHPIAIGAGVIGALVIYMVLRGSSGGAAASGDGTNYADIYAAQAGAQSATQQIQAGLAAKAADNATTVTLAQLAAQSAKDLTGLNFNLELAKTNAGQETTDLANTLTANVALKDISSRVDIAGINADVSKTQFNDLANTLIAQTNANSATAQAAINAAAHSKSSCFLFC